MKWGARIAFVLLGSLSLAARAQMGAQATPIDTPAQPDAIRLYAAGAMPAAKTPEQWDMITGPGEPGRRFEDRIVRNVSQPTLTPVLPAPGRANGTAIVVAPGGGFRVLSMDNEGYAVARRLAEHGIAAFVLKYRLMETPADPAEFTKSMEEMMAAMARPGAPPAISDPRATADALAALRMVRKRAGEWRVDPAKVGMIGFSAGATTSLQAALADTPADRPAFIGYIYGPMSAVTVPADAPPMFTAIAMDDELFARPGSFDIVEAWRAAGRPVELHAYEHGGHGFGTGRPGTTTLLVMDEFVAWLQTHGMGNAPT